MIYYKNAEEKIKEITRSYDFGNICDLENREIEAEESSFDTSSYNFHIISKNENEIATLIKESRKILVDEIKKQGIQFNVSDQLVILRKAINQLIFVV